MVVHICSRPSWCGFKRVGESTPNIPLLELTIHSESCSSKIVKMKNTSPQQLQILVRLRLQLLTHWINLQIRKWYFLYFKPAIMRRCIGGSGARCTNVVYAFLCNFHKQLACMPLQHNFFCLFLITKPTAESEWRSIYPPTPHDGGSTPALESWAWAKFFTNDWSLNWRMMTQIQDNTHKAMSVDAFSHLWQLMPKRLPSRDLQLGKI